MNANVKSVKPAVSIEMWSQLKEQMKTMSVDIPFTFSIKCAQIVGVIHRREPWEESSVDGVVTGCVVGSFHVDKNGADADLYDPSGQLLRMNVHFHAAGREVNGRVDTRQLDGKWSEGDTVVIYRA